MQVCVLGAALSLCCLENDLCYLPLRDLLVVKLKEALGLGILGSGSSKAVNAGWF